MLIQNQAINSVSLAKSLQIVVSWSRGDVGRLFVILSDTVGMSRSKWDQKYAA